MRFLSGHKSDIIAEKLINGIPKVEIIRSKLSTFPPDPEAYTACIKRKWLDIPYAGLLEREKLDIYLPEPGDGPFPVIVWLHGGAWVWGYKNDQQLNTVLEGLRYGYAVISAGYSLSNEAEFPTQVREVKAAIRWIKANGVKYSLDTEKIALFGASAGGHLAALAGTSAEIADLEDLSMGNPQYSSKVQAVAVWCAPVDFLSLDDQFRDAGIQDPLEHNTEDSFVSLYMGDRIANIKEKVEAANAMLYITADTPPFYIQHGLEDSQVPVQQSINLSDKLKKIAGSDKVRLELLKGVGHHGCPEFETKEHITKLLSFLDKHLKNY